MFIIKTAAFFTLGCKVNQYETQAMEELFVKNGYNVVDYSGKADVYVVNSCTVTGMGDKKSRQALRKGKRQNENAITVLTGCYAQSLSDEEIEKTGADIVIGTGNRNKIIDAVEEALKGKKLALVDNINTHRIFEETPIERFDNKTRGMIKIQDGCDRFCSYCKIPYVRGPVRSRNLKSITEEGTRLAKNGFVEVVLTGIQVAAYGKDLNQGSLIEVIEEVAEIEGIERIRLSSLEVVAITQDFLKRAVKTNKLCPSFHLSLQSGSKTVLQRMNRRYTPEEYYTAVELIRKYYPDAGITTDIIVGFPGETEEEFQETYAFAEKTGFSKIHIFPYSDREGTKASKMENKIEKGIKDIRVKKLEELEIKLRESFNAKNTGKTHKVLFEREIKENVYMGYTENYIPVKYESKTNLSDKIVEIVLEEENVINE